MMAEGDPTGAPESAPAEELVRRYSGMVQRALRQLGVEQAALDDAAQDVFLVLHRKALEFDARRSMSNWLWGIARGVASTYRRGQRRRHRLHEALPARSVPPTYPTPDDHLARVRAQGVLTRFLDSLDEDKCAVFVMADIEGHTGAEIAERLGVNVNTVYARLRAARQRFDLALQGEQRTRRLSGPRSSGRRSSGAASFWAWPFGASAKTGMAMATYAAAAVVVVPTVHVSPWSQAGGLSGAYGADVVVSSALTPERTKRSRLSSGPAKVEDESADDDVVLLDEDPMQRITFATATALVLASATPSLAHAKPSAAQAAPQPVASDVDADEAARVTDSEFIFDNDVLTGEVLNPDGTLLLHRLAPKHPSLIHLRAHFVPELIALANDL